MCLDAVRRAFGISAKYPRAIDDWNSGVRRIDPIPAGVAVPVYFSLGTEPAGHIAIRLPDGRVASSTQEGTHNGLYIHPSMNDLIAIYARYYRSCTYLGWSTEVNDVPVINLQQGGSMNSRNFVLAMYAKFQPEARFPDTATSDKVINDHAAYVDTLDLEGLKRWIESFVNDGKGQKGSLAQSGNDQYRQAKDAYKALQQALS